MKIVTETKMKISLSWKSFLVGYFYKEDKLFIFPLPFLVIEIWSETSYYCEDCGSPMRRFSFPDKVNGEWKWIYDCSVHDAHTTYTECTIEEIPDKIKSFYKEHQWEL